jgi:predicted transcriptional regulator
MKARDIMAAPVITASPQATIKSVAETFPKYHISGVPVVDDQGKLVGIISEGDPLHRVAGFSVSGYPPPSWTKRHSDRPATCSLLKC